MPFYSSQKIKTSSYHFSFILVLKNIIESKYFSTIFNYINRKTFLDFYHLSLTVLKPTINFSESSGEILLRRENLILICIESCHNQKQRFYFLLSIAFAKECEGRNADFFLICIT